MSKVIENYVLQEVVGSGQYGKVYRARNMKTDSVVAIKVVKLEKFREIPKLHEFTMNEIQTLSKIENPHVVKFLEMLKTSNNMYLIYEFCNGGTLEQLINKKKFLNDTDSTKILQQIVFAFRSLFKVNIMHRDLKPSNILFLDGIIKIADFGFCKSLQNQTDMTSTMVGSPIYMAPEVLKGQQYSTKADIWSMGVVLFECLFGFCPYEDQSIGRLIQQIDTKELNIPRHINPISKKTEDLLRQMLVVDWKKRIDWQTLFNLVGDPDSTPIQCALALQQQNNQQQHNLMQKKHSSSNLSNNANNITTSNNGPSVPSANPVYQLNSFHSPHPLGINKDLLNIVTPSAVQPQLLQPQSTLSQHQQQFSHTSSQQQQLQQIQDDKIKFNNNLKVLVKERNKILQMANCLGAIIEYNLSSKTPIISFLLMKNINQYAESLKKGLENVGTSNLSKKIEKQDVFMDSHEFKTFNSILQKEVALILNCVEHFKNEINRLMKNQNSLSENQSIKNEVNNQGLDKKFYYQNVINYVDELKDKIKANSLTPVNNNCSIQEKEDYQKKMYMHINETLDTIMIDEFFENFIDQNFKISDQKYFEQLKKYTKDNLNELITHKIDYVKSKYNSA